MTIRTLLPVLALCLATPAAAQTSAEVGAACRTLRNATFRAATARRPPDTYAFVLAARTLRTNHPDPQRCEGTWFAEFEQRNQSALASAALLVAGVSAPRGWTHTEMQQLIAEIDGKRPEAVLTKLRVVPSSGVRIDGTPLQQFERPTVDRNKPRTSPPAPSRP